MSAYGSPPETPRHVREARRAINRRARMDTAKTEPKRQLREYMDDNYGWSVFRTTPKTVVYGVQYGAKAKLVHVVKKVYEARHPEHRPQFRVDWKCGGFTYYQPTYEKVPPEDRAVCARCRCGSPTLDEKQTDFFQLVAEQHDLLIASGRVPPPGKGSIPVKAYVLSAIQVANGKRLVDPTLFVSAPGQELFSRFELAQAAALILCAFERHAQKL